MARKGFTLVEIVAALGILSLLGVLVSETLSRQQRLFRATSEQVDVRRSVRDAVMVLAEEIRGASVRDTVRLMSDSAIELFTSLGSSLVCSSPSGADVALAPTSSFGVSLTSWLAVPDTGDLALIYSSVSSTPGIWQRYRIVASATRSTSSVCPPATGFSSGSATSGSAYVFTLSPAPESVQVGSPIRFVRRGRYSLYRSSDGRWYLGYRRCNAIGVSSCATIQPLSGYYQPYSADTSRTGIFFRYLDAAGQPLSRGSNPLLLASVRISAHAVSAVSVTLDAKGKTAADSASSEAALRNFP